MHKIIKSETWKINRSWETLCGKEIKINSGILDTTRKDIECILYVSDMWNINRFNNKIL